MPSARPPRLLVCLTLGCVALLSGAILFVTRPELPPAVALNIRGQPTLGKSSAPVQVVIFEEPKCSNCREFNVQVFPKLKKSFIDTDLISYSTIMVSFLPDSMAAANALLSVYMADPLYPNPDLFYTYLDYMYDHQPNEGSNWATRQTLLDFAQEASPAINLHTLEERMDQESYRTKVEKNTHYGMQVMEGHLATPTVYVNGIRVPDLTYSSVAHLIESYLRH